jgi:proline racemase
MLLMYEPRGHGAMSGAILQPPARADVDWGVNPSPAGLLL